MFPCVLAAEICDVCCDLNTRLVRQKLRAADEEGSQLIEQPTFFI